MHIQCKYKYLSIYIHIYIFIIYIFIIYIYIYICVCVSVCVKINVHITLCYIFPMFCLCNSVRHMGDSVGLFDSLAIPNQMWQKLMLPLAYASGVWVDVRPRTLRGFRVSMTWATCTMVLLFDAHGCPSPPISQTDWPMSWPLLAKMAPHGTASWHCMCEVPPPQHLQSRAILDPDKRVLSQTDKKHYKPISVF